MRQVLALASAFISLSFGLTQPASPKQEPFVHPLGYLCYRGQGIQIDGKLDDPGWMNAPWTSDFVDIEGDAKPKPRFKTRAKMLWDENYFYVAAWMEEPHVWGTLTKHDSVIFHDNDFEVFIDPNGDNHEYYEFEINALNTGWDLLLPRPYRDGGKAVDSWEIPGLKTAVHIDGTLNDPRDTDRAWSVELAFPWPVLKELAYQSAPPKDGDQWRVNFSRVEWLHEVVDGKYRKVAGKREDNWVWSPQGVIDMHRPEKWGYVQFSTAKPGAATFRPDVAAPAKHLLHQIYYAQREYQKKHKNWATNLDALTLPNFTHESLASKAFHVTPGMFQASVEARTGAKTERWNIRQDSKVWRE